MTGGGEGVGSGAAREGRGGARGREGCRVSRSQNMKHGKGGMQQDRRAGAGGGIL